MWVYIISLAAGILFFFPVADGYKQRETCFVFDKSHQITL